MKRLLVIVALSCAFAQAQTVQPLLQPRQTFVDSAGSPCTGCKLYSYLAGTTTASPTYTDSTGVTPNTNPIVLDVAGGANIWMAARAYKLVLKGSDGSTIWTVDNVNPGAGFAGYLPTAGGTLTGLLSGTSANLSGTIAAGTTVLLSATSSPVNAERLADLNAAVAAATSGQLVQVATAINLTANLTVNVPLSVIGAGCITQTGSYTLTINGPFSAAGKAFCGFSPGQIVFGVGTIDAQALEWYGGKGDGNATCSTGTDNTAAINMALGTTTPMPGGVIGSPWHYAQSSFPMPLRMRGGVYCHGSIVFPGGASTAPFYQLTGAGRLLSVLAYTGTGTAWSYAQASTTTAANMMGLEVRDVGFVNVGSGGASSVFLNADGMDSYQFYNYAIQDFYSQVIGGTTSTRGTYSGVFQDGFHWSSSPATSARFTDTVFKLGNGTNSLNTGHFALRMPSMLGPKNAYNFNGVTNATVYDADFEGTAWPNNPTWGYASGATETGGSGNANVSSNNVWINPYLDAGSASGVRWNQSANVEGGIILSSISNGNQGTNAFGPYVSRIDSFNGTRNVSTGTGNFLFGDLSIGSAFNGSLYLPNAQNLYGSNASGTPMILVGTGPSGSQEVFGDNVTKPYVYHYSASDTFASDVFFSAHANQSATKTIAGTCAMSAGTTCTFTLTEAFNTEPLTIAGPQGASYTGGMGYCSVSGTTATITAPTANSLTWGCTVIGNPY